MFGGRSLFLFSGKAAPPAAALWHGSWTSLPFSVVLEELRTHNMKQLPEYVVLEKKCKTEALVRLCTVLG